MVYVFSDMSVDLWVKQDTGVDGIKFQRTLKKASKPEGIFRKLLITISQTNLNNILHVVFSVPYIMFF